MVQEEIKTLFKKYLYRQLTSEEVIRLKALIQNMDDCSLEQNLSQLWDTYPVSGERNIEAFSNYLKKYERESSNRKKR